MDPVIVIAALKVIGALLGGVLGVLGVLFNFRQSDNRITGWGIVILVGIVISAAAGIFGSIVEGYKAKSEAALQSTRTEALLKEVSRAIQPITQLKITYWFKLPSEAPGVPAYVDRVSKSIEAQLGQLPTMVTSSEDEAKANPLIALSKDVHVTASGINDEPLTIDLGLHSPLWPRGKEPPVGLVTLDFHFKVFIKKTPIAPAEFLPVIGTDTPDAADWIATSSLAIDPNRNRLTFDRRTKSLVIFGTADFPKEFWYSNGKITSIVDLYGAQLVLVPAHA